MLPGLVSLAGVSGVSKSLIFNTFTSSTSDLTTYTFSSQSFGQPDAGRVVAVCVDWASGSSRSISSATIGGVSATIQFSQSGASNAADLIYAVVPSGTSGDVVVTMSGACTRMAIAIYSMYDLSSSTPASSLVSFGAGSVTVPTGGFGIAYAGTNATGTTTWDAAGSPTEDCDFVFESACQFSTASYRTPGTFTPSVTPSDDRGIVIWS